MSKQYAKKQALEKSRNIVSGEKDKSNTNLFSKHLKRVYPIGLQRTCSALSLSSLSLSLSQNSTDSSLTDSSTPIDQKISLALRLIAPAERREAPLPKIVQQPSPNVPSEEGTRRCNWITKVSDKVYVQFHDECWGVPVYDDKEAFAGFDPNNVSKMAEKEILDIASNKELTLAESRVVRECGSFSSYMWEYVSYKPVINKFRFPRNVPLRSPKAEIISKDLVRRGFRFVGPVIVYSFMQAAGMTIDHLVDCFRYNECVNLAERPWRHV
ncbi:UNVERIFIED_CONTAM: DNA-3-methyladenine glycosylase 1 [Sesamum angustifolium]|uniref:DNA-3-methyladenine glycosylase 1 n=1 Tax=Sesamum angustifolium TaxID=2727405 RepID=A0AAW2M6Q5_9LAMI